MSNYSEYVDENINSALNALVNKTMTNLRVATLCRITSVNSDGTVDLQPMVREKISTSNGYSYMKLPLLKNVHTVQGQSFIIGKLAVAIHLDRNIGNAFSEGVDYIDSGKSRHALTDCIALALNG